LRKRNKNKEIAEKVDYWDINENKVKRKEIDE